MTVPSTALPKHIYNADGVTRDWEYSFPIDVPTDITVYYTDANGATSEITGSFSVNTDTNKVTYPTIESGLAILTEGQITLLRKTALTQITDFQNQGAFNAETMEAVADKLTMIVQEQKETLNRCVQYPVNENPDAAETSEFLLTVQQARADALAASQDAAAQVDLAEAQVALATTQAELATTNGQAQVVLATAQAGIATTKAAEAAASAASVNFTKDNDGTMAANSDAVVPSQKAVKTYVDGKVVTDASISVTDITTNNASTSKHGFLKKLSNVATEFMNGVGNWVAITIDSILPSQTGNAGKFLTTNGSTASWASPGGKTLLLSGSGSWVAPAGVTAVLVSGVAGGGSGGCTGGSGLTGGGGGGGESADRILMTVTPGNSYSYSIGTGGAAVTSGRTTGNDGNNTTFDTLTLLAGKKGIGGSDVTGGGNGGGTGASAGGAGGATSGANGTSAVIQNQGTSSATNIAYGGRKIGGGGGGAGRNGAGGVGGGTFWGQGGTAGVAGTYGGGGGGNVTTEGQPSGKGGDGFLLLEW